MRVSFLSFGTTGAAATVVQPRRSRWAGVRA